MNLKIVGLLALILIGLAQAATIRGYTYNFYTLEKLNNTIIEIDTQPVQQIVAKNGYYEFAVPAGKYLLIAKYYSSKRLIALTEENLSIAKDGVFDFDLLLEPVGNSTSAIFIPEIPSDVDQKPDYNVPLMLIGFGLVLFLMYYNHKHGIDFPGKRTRIEEAGKAPKAEEPAQRVAIEINKHDLVVHNKASASPEAGQIYDVILKSEGRIQQKELRKIFKFSEAKMSNLLDELEESGKIRRIKKGRGNLIKSI